MVDDMRISNNKTRRSIFPAGIDINIRDFYPTFRNIAANLTDGTRRC